MQLWTPLDVARPETLIAAAAVVVALRDQCMTDYCARVRVRLGDRVRIASDEQEIAIEMSSDKTVVLQSSPASLPLSQAEHVALVARPYTSEAEAAEAAAYWRAILPRAFARLNIGADFGDRAATGAATAHGLAALEAQHGTRVLNDVRGAMAFECAPWPRFVRFEASGTVGKPADRLQAVLHTAARRSVAMSEREMLAYDLFSASFSAKSADARFALLMMALETLIDPEPRARPVAEHVDLLTATTENSDLPSAEIASIVGSLRLLRSESVGQAGRRLARRLGDRRYMEEASQTFFRRCYDMRSKLVHGAYPRPSRSDVDQRAAPLELFLRDLMSLDLLDDFPEA